MTTALAKPLQPDEWGMLQALATTIFESHLFPSASSPSAAAAIMLTGRDLGVGYAAALQGITMIKNKVTISPALAWGIITASGQLEDWNIGDLTDAKGNATGCLVTMKRLHGNSYSVLYTVEDAARAGLVKPDSNWISYPANMCRWRAIGFCADILFPDLLFGIRRYDELGGNITPDGEIIFEEAAA